MKIPAFFLLSAAIFAGPWPVRADYEIHKTLEMPLRQKTEQTICRVKGSSCRLDSGDGNYMVMDPKTGLYFLVDLNSRKVVDFSAVAQDPATAAPNRFEGPAPTFEATGKKDKIDGYEVEEFTCGMGSGTNSAFWVARDYPKDKGAALKEEERRISVSAASTSKVPLPDFTSLPGPVLRIVTTDPNGKVLTLSTVTSVSVDPLDARQFEVPAGFQMKKLTADAAEFKP